MADSFNIIDYVQNAVIGYPLTAKEIHYILLERGLTDVTSFDELTQRDKDLLKADCIYRVISSQLTVPSKSWSHGDATKSIGQQKITNDEFLRLVDLMTGLYQKWGEKVPAPVEWEGGINILDILDF